MNKFVLRQSLLLFLTAVIWGSAFVAQSVGMDYVEPFTFTAVRNLIGTAVLLPYIGYLEKLRGSRQIRQGDEGGRTVCVRRGQKENERSTLLAGGISCGVLLFAASNLQQFGIRYTTVGKAGFITAMYIVLVPLLGIFLKKKAGVRVWLGVAAAAAGLYQLCMTEEGFYLQSGDVITLLCALVFAVHILVIDFFAPKVDGVKMSCIQFFVCSILSAVCMLLFEKPDVTDILQAWAPILYAGVLSSGVGFTLQIVAQRGMNPTVASLILSLESVVSVIAAWLVLGQVLSLRELLGCVLMFAAIILVQLPEKQ